MPEVETIRENTYQPTDHEEELRDDVYRSLKDFVEERERTWTQFNNRTLEQYLDDSEKRVNAYAPSKESQGKEEWQSNVTLPIVRDKLKRLIAGFSLRVPEMHLKAFGPNQRLDLDKAGIAKNLVEGSYIRNENPVLSNFWEAWGLAVKGIAIKYEGYLKTSYKQKYIKSYDPVTGEVEFDEKEVNVDDRCVSVDVDPMELYIRDFEINDVQMQPDIAWVRYLHKPVFEKRFGKYKNSEYVKTGQQLKNTDIARFYKHSDWDERVDQQKVEVIRYYNRLEDQYVIVANGVILLEAPLLWEVNGKKQYPFGKVIFEPFEDKHFFYGESLPNLLMGHFDTYCTIWNTLIDKQYRSMNRPLLVGMTNQDAFELEDEYLDYDTKIYVNDIGQVDQLKIDGVDNADVTMLELVAKGIEGAAPSLPDYLSDGQTTAREVVIAEEKLRQIKSSYAEMMADLWRQKYYLRLSNIQLHYPQPRTVVNERGKEEKVYRTFHIPNTIIDKQKGKRGTLAIQFRDDISDKNRGDLQEEADVEAEVMRQQGEEFKKLIIPDDYLDNHRFKIEVMTDTLYKASHARRQAKMSEKLSHYAKFFPHIFLAAQDELFSQLAEAYEDNPDQYLDKKEALAQARKAMQQASQRVNQQGRQKSSREQEMERLANTEIEQK